MTRRCLCFSESPLPDRRAMSRDDSGLKPVISMPVFPGGHIHDSSSTSSCNSSTPSSPALHISSGTLTSPSPAPSHLTQFQFPPGLNSGTYYYHPSDRHFLHMRVGESHWRFFSSPTIMQDHLLIGYSLVMTRVAYVT